MALSALALCSRALLKIGAQPIASLEEGTAEAEVAANLYPSVRDAALSAHPWSFATGQASLPRLAAQPHADYAHAFQLPAGFLRALSAGDIAYRIHEDKLHTYVFRPDEADFPPFFASALVARLAAEFCIPLTESGSRAELLFRLADREMREARLVDSQQDTPRALAHFPLISARG
jgi:hypothetical protein